FHLSDLSGDRGLSKGGISSGVPPRETLPSLPPVDVSSLAPWAHRFRADAVLSREPRLKEAVPTDPLGQHGDEPQYHRGRTAQCPGKPAASGVPGRWLRPGAR